VDNAELERALRQGAAALGVALTDEAASRLLRLAAELLRWSEKVNLTAITEPGEVVEKHLLDSLAVAPELEGTRSLLDLGAGAGFPGLPLKILRPELQVTLVDSVAKKVGFIKHAIAQLGLAPGARAVHQRAGGQPEREGLPRAEAVVSRALMEVGPWLGLAGAYLAPAGTVLAMLGRTPEEAELAATAAGAGFRLESLRRYALPFSGAPRAVARFVRDG
jgi:16S rRNA (guanine527-N7)-methyltransferase